MKTCTVFAVTATLAIASFESATAMPGYEKNLPHGGDNPALKRAGHLNAADKTKFAAVWKEQMAKGWDSDFCKQPFADDDTMTNGEALGDPCCTWSSDGGDVSVLVEVAIPADDAPWTKTVCATAEETEEPTEEPAEETEEPTEEPAEETEEPTEEPTDDTPEPTTPTVTPSKCGVKDDVPASEEDKEGDDDDSDIGDAWQGY